MEKQRGWRTRREKESDSRFLDRFSLLPTPLGRPRSFKKVQQRVQKQNGWRWTGTPLGVRGDEEGKPIERREGRPDRSNGSWSRYCMALPDELSAENIAILVSKSREPSLPGLNFSLFLSLSLSIYLSIYFSLFLSTSSSVPLPVFHVLSLGPRFFQLLSSVFRSRKQGNDWNETGVEFKGWFRGSRSFRLPLVVSGLRISGRICYIGTHGPFISVSFFLLSLSLYVCSSFHCD